MSAERTKRVAIFGATGVAGGGVLRACLAATEITGIVAITRRPLGIESSKLREVHCEDFNDLNPIAADVSGVDCCFYCLGISVSGLSEAEYRVITMDYALAAARTMNLASPSHTFHFLSGSGTDINSPFMWARVKGETEKALKELGLAGLVCWRPGMILANEPPKHLSPLMRAAYPVLRLVRFIPALSVQADDFGFAMVQIEKEGRRDGTIGNLAIRAAAERYRGRA